MNPTDTNFAGSDLEKIFRRWLTYAELVEGNPWIPDLPPGISPSQARRMAARLRSGALFPVDPAVPPEALAWLLEKSAAKTMTVWDTVAILRDARMQEWAEEEERYAAESRSFVAGFHRLKESVREEGPDSPEAEQLRQLHRLRRQEGRRSRKR